MHPLLRVAAGVQSHGRRARPTLLLTPADAPPCAQTVVLPLSFGNVGINAPPCPIVAGAAYNVSINILLPAGVPSGDYQVIVSSMDQAQGNGYCLNASFSL